MSALITVCGTQIVGERGYAAALSFEIDRSVIRFGLFEQRTVDTCVWFKHVLIFVGKWSSFAA